MDQIVLKINLLNLIINYYILKIQFTEAPNGFIPLELIKLSKCFIIII